jgi:DNA replication and repair protein RecF
MRIQSISLCNFRCFEKFELNCNAPITLLEGCNGSGKSSIVEALHYACYLRSFRANSPVHMIRFNQEAFAIKLHGATDGETWDLVVGASADKRQVKLNGKAITSYKQILDRYRVITITEEDLELMQGYPESRRAFLDTTLFMMHHDYVATMRLYLKTLKQRTALFMRQPLDMVTYEIWSEKLEELSGAIQFQRKELLQKLELEVNALLKIYSTSDARIRCEYKTKGRTEDLLDREKRAQRTLFGAHLDEITIFYENQHSRHFASRGQQKMIVILFKLAALKLLNRPALLLLDDFMTDFDNSKITQLLEALLAGNNQIIITCPLKESRLAEILKNYQAHVVSLETHMAFNASPYSTMEHTPT